MATSPFALPLIGRAEELARLESIIAAVEAGRSATLLLVGEGGAGKTRLARAAAEAAARRGFAVAEGRAYSVESGVPYAVFADALAPTLRRLDAAALNVLTRGAAGELVHIFPGLLSASHPERGASGESASEAKARLYWTFVQLLGRLAARQPLLLLLDNLQWADAASLELLHFVARQAHAPGLGGRVLIVGTYNDADAVPALLRDAEQSLVALGAARVERVTTLSADETLELVRRSFDVSVESVRGFASMLHEWTRGNPFFIEETLKSLVESGQLQQRDGRWSGWSVESIALPRTVRDAVMARVERLSAGARALLDLAAVHGARVRYATLRAVSEAPDETLIESLDELCRARLLLESDEAKHDGYDFSHPLVRDAVYGALGRRRAQLLHAQIAAALERLHGADALAHADELAFHFSRAGAGTPHRKALRYLAESGRRALDRHADRAAATYLEAALAMLDGAGVAVEDADVMRTAVLEGLARARQRLGEHEAAETLWLRLRSNAVQRDDQRTVAAVERRMGLMHTAGGRHDRAIERYDAGIAAATRANDDELATRLRLARANSLQALGRRDEARRDVQAALDAAIALGDEPLLARVHRAMLLLHLWTGPVADARAHGERAVALAAESGERLVEWSAHWAMAILGGLTGDAVSTAHHVRESERLADVIHSPVLRLWTDEVAIEYMAGIGEWTAALARAEQAIPAARALGQRTLLTRVLVWTGLIHRGLGDAERAREHIEEAWRLAGGDSMWERPLDVHAVVPAHTGMAGYLIMLGENERAVEIGERGLAIADRTGDVAWAIYRLLPFVIENSLYLEDYERAARHNARLRRESEALGHALGLAWADATDALLTYLTGDARDAVPLLRDAASALEAVPFVFDAARLRRLIGRAMVDAGDEEGAERELRRAYDVFVRLGAQREIRATREQLRALGARPPAAVTASGAGALSGRETEIARLVAARKSNKEIGTTLDISPRTVSTHLSNIFAKLGVASRGELTDLVRGGGLD
ncbi:MAG TPA: BREX system ATP-binding domain-containing protein [Gemmatimonadaceae bacterium]|nr:BREX system ATP-binding domain-containing protein [Gemmatimonadaceae bacterium]